jgi:hypothetical protein
LKQERAALRDAVDQERRKQRRRLRKAEDPFLPRGFRLEDASILAMVKEYPELATNHIQTIFPQLVIQQIHNTLVARQLLPKGPDHFELIFHFFGYEDDTPELRALRIKQANLVGPAGYISMEVPRQSNSSSAAS